MEGFSFDSLHACYKLESVYTVQSKDYYQSAYSSHIDIQANIDEKDGNYNFIITRSNVLLNGKPVSKLMDRIMYEIGNSLYPLVIKASNRSEIIDILNFDEIKVRWTRCGNYFIKKYPSYQLDHYISMSEKNLISKEDFIISLYQDTFTNIYFRNIYTPPGKNEAGLIKWQNFPEKEMNQSYLYQMEIIDKDEILLSGEIMQIVPEHNGTFNMEYKTGKYGEILHTTGKVESNYKGKLYFKEITLDAETISIKR